MPMKKLLMTIMAILSFQSTCADPARKVLNIVHFVRALDPRISRIEYVRALDEEVKLNRQYGFPNTILLQYDALVDSEMLATAQKSDPEKTEFGLWFEMSRPLNEAARLVWKPTEKHKDWNGERRKSVWYNSRFYRANLIMDGNTLIFRDIHKMADDFEEPFLNKKCIGWQALYFTPPIVDQWLFRGDGSTGTMAFDGKFSALSTEAVPGDSLLVTAMRAEGARVTVRFEERQITVSGANLSSEYSTPFRKNMKIGDGEITFHFSGYGYRLPVQGELKATEKGFSMGGPKIVLDLAVSSVGERLYNNIILPPSWPPHLDAFNQGPMRVAKEK